MFAVDIFREPDASEMWLSTVALNWQRRLVRRGLLAAIAIKVTLTPVTCSYRASKP